MHQPSLSRRDLLKFAPATLLAASALEAADGPPVQLSQRIDKGWEHYRGNIGSVWEIWRGNKASDNVTWQPVELPHCYNARDAVDPDQPYYQGPGWYRTNIKIENPFPNGRTLLHFEAAGQRSFVCVYTENGGTHQGGYDEWTVDITELAQRFVGKGGVPGAVPIAVWCDNSREAELIPSSLSDFNLYGGLYRHVNLVYRPALSIERLIIDPAVSADGKATVTVRGRFANPLLLKDKTDFELRVFDPHDRVIHTAPRNITAQKGEYDIAMFDVEKPELWSPSNPVLYRCEAVMKSTHGESRVVERFGLRSFDFVENGPFLLNGQRLLLRGTHRHEDHAGLGAAMPDDLIRREMRMIKDMGANFIRLGHYQQSRTVLDCCDELGLLVWEEIPWCRGGLGGIRYKEQARMMLRNMIDQHRNHPSVILWGLGNENDWPGEFETFDKEAIRAFMQEMNLLAHHLDPSRKTVIRRCDFCKDIPDVYSPSIWAGWYRGKFTEYKSEVENQRKQVKRFIHAEWGGDSHARRHSEDPDKGLTRIATGQGADERGLEYLLIGGQDRASRDGDWSETYICNLFDWHLKEQETMEWLSGAAQWAFKDFSTPLRPENPVPRMNQKGLVERDLTPKEGYYVFQSYWSEKPMARIYGHSWPVRWGSEGEQKLVKVYSNCPVAELFVNGKSLGERKRNSQDFPAAGQRWAARFRSGENQLRVVAKARDGSEVTDEIRFRYETRKWGKPARLEFAEIGREGEVVRLEARLVDARGVPCLDARTPVRFGATGDGRLIDNLGTSTGSRAVEMYNGRAVISLRQKAGQSVACVSAKDLASVFLTIKA